MVTSLGKWKDNPQYPIVLNSTVILHHVMSPVLVTVSYPTIKMISVVMTELDLFVVNASLVISYHLIPLGLNASKLINAPHAEITFGVDLLSVMFWFVVIVMIIAVSYNIGNILSYAGVVIYFYSMIDYLLGDIDDWPTFQFVTILSNLARLNPKFLGTLCITSDTGWSGIDQQFFHYFHPLAIFCVMLTFHTWLDVQHIIHITGCTVVLLNFAVIVYHVTIIIFQLSESLLSLTC